MAVVTGKPEELEEFTSAAGVLEDLLESDTGTPLTRLLGGRVGAAEATREPLVAASGPRAVELAAALRDPKITRRVAPRPRPTPLPMAPRPELMRLPMTSRRVVPSQ